MKLTDLSHERVNKKIKIVSMVGAIGFEPTTYGTQNRRATKLRHAPNSFVLRMKHRFDKSDILVGVILKDFLPFYFCSIKIPSVNPTALSYWRLHP